MGRRTKPPTEAAEPDLSEAIEILTVQLHAILAQANQNRLSGPLVAIKYRAPPVSKRASAALSRRNRLKAERAAPAESIAGRCRPAREIAAQRG